MHSRSHSRNSGRVPERRRRRSRAAGRPPVGSEEDVRNALLDAAERLFLKHGFANVTARQIAAAAGAAPAMINYYFTNKLGLFRAMLERAIQPVRALLAGAVAGEPGRTVEAPDLIALLMRTIEANSWAPTFIVNEVFAERGRFRATFNREVAGRHAPLIVELIERGKVRGRFRADLDARFAALSLLSLCLFPFVARSVAGPVLGLKFEGAELERLIAHNARLFLGGVERRGRA